MSQTIVQLNYKVTTSVDEHMPLIEPAAEPIAAQPGLIWKIWLRNDAEHEVGGIYLFESLEAAQAYLNSPIVKGLTHPTIHNVSVKLFEPMEAMSQITHAPITWGNKV